ncbi:unnamed protein product [Didymodactylos carnosus]|uniref:3-phytase n=1 Tax=Didymodactylos carnosus TaxID=1234261 RepID=A0A814YBA5_9BILA|nr:unnamed protein product [Didymodactylos carnosus]CAF3989855.1 unnamed protein product [Didymodactylos carnosus]
MAERCITHSLDFHAQQTRLSYADGFDKSRYWGNLSPYHPADGFGVEYNEIPSDCKVSQVHILHRHGQRFPTSEFDDGGNTQRFAYKVRNASVNGILGATGALAY